MSSSGRVLLEEASRGLEALLQLRDPVHVLAASVAGRPESGLGERPARCYGVEFRLEVLQHRIATFSDFKVSTRMND